MQNVFNHLRDANDCSAVADIACAGINYQKQLEQLADSWQQLSVPSIVFPFVECILNTDSFECKSFS